MYIGKFKTNGNIFLAPMAGVTDLPFRIICKKLGCELMYTEMINAKAVCYEDQNTFEMLKTVDEEGDIIVQIFGSEPNFMGKSAEIIADLNRFKAIDINMGCPVPKVVRNNEGSALMKNLPLASKIISAVKNSSTLPVTVKFRLGWDSESINVVEFAKMAEQSGADAVAVHGRTREQYYSGKANWDYIAEVKQAVKIPVIANGDIFTIDDAVAIIEKTGADAIMIGRGAQGNPFIFKEFSELEKTGTVPNITNREKIDTLLEHYNISIEHKGIEKSLREMRKHIGWYLKGMVGAARMRDEVNRMENYEEVIQKLLEYKDSLK